MITKNDKKDNESGAKRGATNAETNSSKVVQSTQKNANNPKPGNNKNK